MTVARFPDRYRLGDVDPASFGVQLGRDSTIAFQLLEWDRRVVGDPAGGLFKLHATVRELPGDAVALVARECQRLDQNHGTWSLEFLADDFPDVEFELGQRHRCLWLDLRAEVTDPETDLPRSIAVFDPTGRAAFPLYLHQRLGAAS